MGNVTLNLAKSDLHAYPGLDRDQIFKVWPLSRS